MCALIEGRRGARDSTGRGEIQSGMKDIWKKELDNGSFTSTDVRSGTIQTQLGLQHKRSDATTFPRFSNQPPWYDSTLCEYMC
jgi:hypothetical protein